MNRVKIDIKQLLDEVEHDIMDYQNRGLCYPHRRKNVSRNGYPPNCYLPKPKAEADNTDTRV